MIHWIAYAYQLASGNTQWVKPYIPALQKFADYLVDNGLYPAKQQSSIDSIGATANQTVLAMYAAIGLTSFGALTGLENYTAVGKSFVPVILELGTDPEKTHFMAHYNDDSSSWVSTYPFAYDKMLRLGTFNESTYAMQSKWYEGELHTYGMQLFSGVTYAVGSLVSWCAATSSNSVRSGLLNGIHAFITDGMNNEPGPGLWFVTGPMEGQWRSNIAKSTCGSYFMPAAVHMHYRRSSQPRRA